MDINTRSSSPREMMKLSLKPTSASKQPTTFYTQLNNQLTTTTLNYLQIFSTLSLSLLIKMKFSVSTPLLALAAFTQIAAANEWECGQTEGDGGLRRYFWRFKGYCEDQYGQCFLRSIRSHGVVEHNWQCGKAENGWWHAELSSSAGLAPSINGGIEDVTGVKLSCWNGM